MLVKELINTLSAYNPELRVVVDGYECGYDEVEQVRLTKITQNIKREDKDWEGEFKEVLDHNEITELALYIPRKS
jgi:hypothetical protein